MKNIKIKLLTFEIVLLFTSFIIAQTTQEWVQVYDQPDNRNSCYASITDLNGNSYLTGSFQVLQGDLTSEDFLTLKYDKDGNLIWKKTFDGGGGSNDEAKAITLDNDGNVYVTGFSGTNVNELDEYYTIKYSPDGNEVWHAVFNGPESFGIKWNDHATDIFVDEDKNVYVVGIVQEYDDSTYYVHNNIGVVKYNSEGVLEFSNIYDSPNHGDEIPQGISVNKFGQIFIAGSTSPQNDGSASDMILLMYNKNGALSWNVQYNGPNSGEDEALLLTTDKYGYAYLSGYQKTGGEADLYIAKYDTSGTVVWDDVINSSSFVINPNIHYPVSMAIDKNDNLYINAYNSGFENFLAKYDLNGNRKWISTWNGILNVTEPSNIVFDSENNIYLMGDNGPHDASKGAVLGVSKFNPDGSKLWDIFYDDNLVDDGRSWTNRPIGIGIDKENSIYLTGRSSSNDGDAFELVKFSQSVTAVKYEKNLPKRFSLSQNYPNPFNPTTTIKYSIPLLDRSHATSQQMHVQLKVYDVLGNEVGTLVNEEKHAGNYQVTFNASNLASGIYYYTLKFSGKSITKKCLLIK